MATITPPVLDAFRYENDRGEVSLVVWCAPCGRWHWHGAGTGPGEGDGHRVAHCINPRSPYNVGGYVLREVGRITGRAMREIARPGKQARKRKGAKHG